MDLTPLYGLRLRTDRLQLRLPDEEELIQLARLAESGIHDPVEMPFVVPWTDEVGKPGFIDRFVAYHLGVRETWSAEQWQLELGVWAADDLIGIQAVVGHDFTQTRELKTGSWVGQQFQGRGYGAEMRAAVLELAFHGLGAQAALSSSLDGVEASRRISLKLGYVDDGESWLEVRGQRRLDRHLRLTRDRWTDQERISVRISGLEECFPLFGLNGPPEPWVPTC